MATSLEGGFIAPLQFSNEQGSISARRLALLQAIDEEGSISAAAKKIGITYKAAWDGVDSMNNLSTQLLVKNQQGGAGGGGAALTELGKELLHRYQRIYALQHAFMEQLNQPELQDTYQLLRRLTMNTSAGNALYGTVQTITEGAVNTEVVLSLAGGETLCSIITKDSAERLKLTVGMSACALIKSSWVLLGLPSTSLPSTTLAVSARNQLQGTIQRIDTGAVNSEVVLELPGGTTLRSVVTNQSVETLDLKEGSAVVALIKASHVILGVNE